MKLSHVLVTVAAFFQIGCGLLRLSEALVSHVQGAFVSGFCFCFGPWLVLALQQDSDWFVVPAGIKDIFLSPLTTEEIRPRELGRL